MIRVTPLIALSVLASLGCGCSSVEVLDLFPIEGAAGAGSPGPTDSSPELVVSDVVDLSVTGVRDCDGAGDAAAYSVIDLAADRARLERAPASGCLASGDELLLINLQGTSDSVVNVGRYEFVAVRALDQDVVWFDGPKTLFYGDEPEDDANIGIGSTQQRVVLQRVPTYSRVEVTESGTLTARTWNGQSGGVLVLRVDGEVVIDGAVAMDEAGYRGGATTDPPESPGQQGESIGGIGGFLYDPNRGGGGGGIADQTTRGCQQDGYPGGGGAHLLDGETAEVHDLCGGVGAGGGGFAYAMDGRLTLGSGGGSAGTDNVRTDNPPGGAGGRGGGVIWILAASITGSGSITADGAGGVGDPEGVECLGGATDRCYDHSGPGGGGGGGLVRLSAATIHISTVSARGGPGGNGNDDVAGNGGDGGDGRVERLAL